MEHYNELIEQNTKHTNTSLPRPRRSLSRFLAPFLGLLLLTLALLEARARDEPHDEPQKQVLVLAPKHSLESRVGWSGVECWLVG